MNISEVPTPALLVDHLILKKNIARMQDRATRLGVRLRPHIKTHKSLEIAMLQQEAGASGITVSTLAEARYFARHGFTDITWAFPIPPAAVKEIIALQESCTLRVLTDSMEAAEILEAECRKSQIQVSLFIKIDCGSHRAGIDPHSPLVSKLARKISDSPALIFDGILTHAGHSYKARSRNEIVPVAREEQSVMAECAEQIRSDGIPCSCVSIGSTPTMSVAEHLDGIDEIRPGNYAYHDFHQVSVGSCTLSDCALTVLASVVSHQPGAEHCVADAGALSLSKDSGPAHTGYSGNGMIFEEYDQKKLYSGMQMGSLSQEHGIVQSVLAKIPDGKFRIGDRIRILENHSCLTAACFDEMFVIEGEEVIDRWKIFRGRG